MTLLSELLQTLRNSNHFQHSTIYYNKSTYGGLFMNLKRRLLPLLIIPALAICLFAGCGKKDAAETSKVQKPAEETLTKITLNEVAHSIFYAPMYAAIENNYFKEEGIDLELVTGFGADKVMAAVFPLTAYCW